MTWMTGGQATLDGVQGEKVDNLGLGITLGYHINDSEPTDLHMDGFRLSLVFGCTHSSRT